LRSGVPRDQDAAKKRAARLAAEKQKAAAEGKAAHEAEKAEKAKAAAEAEAKARAEAEVKAKREAEVAKWAGAKATAEAEQAARVAAMAESQGVGGSDLHKEERWRESAAQLQGVTPASAEALQARSPPAPHRARAPSSRARAQH
jgi:colicin import membrane protein